ncbi:hypothetical protein Hdeb2414_s0402g00886701 [Helianthus debilis subsp. tardiflorus]
MCLSDCMIFICAHDTNTMDSSGTGESDTTGPRPIVSDDLVSLEHEIHTSDVTSTDEDDFQPFALPDAVDEPADGPFAGNLPLVEIPAPIPLASYPVLDMLLDADVDDDVDFFDDEPLEDDIEGEALLADGGLLLLADAPAEESPAHSPVPDSFESVASAPSHTHDAQHFSHGSDPDRASSAAPSFAFDHDIEEDSDPVFPPGFDPDQDIEFIPLDQPMEDPVDPVDPAFLDHADFEMAFDNPEPAMALEPVAAHDPVFEHDPIHAGAPIVDPVIDDLPVDDHPVDAPLFEGDHVVAADHIDAPSSLMYLLTLLLHPFLTLCLCSLIVHFLRHMLTPEMSTPRMGRLMLMMSFHLFPLIPPMHITLIPLFRSLSTHLQLDLERVPRLIPLDMCRHLSQLYHSFPLLFPLFHHSLCHLSIQPVSHFSGRQRLLCHHPTPTILSIWGILLRTFLCRLLSSRRH